MKALEDALQSWISDDITEPVYLLKVDDDESVISDESDFVVFTVSEEEDQQYLNSEAEYSADVDLRVYSHGKYYPRDLIDRIANRVAVDEIPGITLLETPEISKGNGTAAADGWFYYPMGINIYYKE